jgi:phosphatidylglycerol:prolipoprotein diacylglycerol transferase
LLIAQGVGRWGNFVNQELYGSPSNLPWAIKIAPEYRLPGFEAVERYHPMFFYEFALNLIAAGILLLLTNANRKKRFLFKGDIFLLYLVLYPVIRFGLEFLRLDPSAVSGYNINQTIMGVVAIIAIVTLLGRHLLAKSKNLEVETEGLDLTEIKHVEPDLTNHESELKTNDAELEKITDKELTDDLDELSKQE